jgi:hypothetical protein
MGLKRDRHAFYFAIRVISISLLLYGFALAAQQDTTWGVRVSFVQGAIRIQKPGMEGWLKADTGLSYFPGDKIQAGKKSKAELTLSDGQIIRLGQNSTIALMNVADSKSDTSLTGDIQSSLIPKSFQLIEGDFWSFDKGSLNKSRKLFFESFKKGTVEIAPNPDTGIVVLRILIGADSTVEARVYEGTAAVTLNGLEATVDSTNDIAFPEYTDSTGIKLCLYPSEKILMTYRGKLVFKGSFARDDIDEKTDWVDWNKTRDNIK